MFSKNGPQYEKERNENICDGEFLKKQMWQSLELDTMHKIEQYT
jgi:hypothetical protein